MKKKMSTSEFIRKAVVKHGNKFNYDLCVYDDYLKPIIIKCNTCKNFFNPTPSNHLLGTKCPNCNAKKQRLTTESFVKISILAHGDKYDYASSNYVTAKNKIRIICKKCNLLFEQLPRSHMYGKSGCPKCKSSRGENKILTLLKSININFIQQHKFNNCLGRKNTKLPFDFYLPNLNTCIEYDGRQHYDKKSKFWNERIEINDKIKNEYCKSNNIKLIRINENEFNIIEEIIKQSLFH